MIRQNRLLCFYPFSLFHQEQAEDQRGYPGAGKLQEAFSAGHLLQLAGGAGRPGGVGQDARAACPHLHRQPNHSQDSRLSQKCPLQVSL